MKRSAERKIDKGWQALVGGDWNTAAKRATRAGDLAAGRLLALQSVLIEGRIDATAELESFCVGHPDYAAAWITLSVAAERAGRETVALTAARTGADLWTDERWRLRADELYRRWVAGRLDRARVSLESGDPGAALAEVEAALLLDPDSTNARLLRVEILVADDSLDDAEAALSGLEGEPRSLELRGHIAELRGNWQAAMEAYALLPSDHRGRDVALERAQTRWRLSVLPAHAKAAMAADHLTRGDLAILLVATLPNLETIQGGHVPVMSDIVDHPGQREIVTVVRLGIMEADLRDHRFHPDLRLDRRAVRQAVDRTASRLGRPAPAWCEEPNVIPSDCVPLPSLPGGAAVVSAVLGMASGAGP